MADSSRIFKSIGGPFIRLAGGLRSKLSIKQGLRPSISVKDFIGHLKRPGIPILGLASGKGEDELFLAKKGFNVVATDIDPKEIEFLASNAIKNIIEICTAITDVNGLQFSAKSFEAIYMRLGLHYFCNDQLPRVISEMARVLKPGGLIFTVVKSREDHYYKQFGETERQDGMVSCIDPLTGKGYLRRFFGPNELKNYFGSNFDIKRIYAHNERLFEDKHISSLLTLVGTKALKTD